MSSVSSPRSEATLSRGLCPYLPPAIVGAAESSAAASSIVLSPVVAAAAFGSTSVGEAPAFGGARVNARFIEYSRIRKPKLGKVVRRKQPSFDDR